MKTAGIVIDGWKLSIFMKHLDKAVYAYTVRPGPTRETLTLTVKYEWVNALKPLVEAANEECAKVKRN